MIADLREAITARPFVPFTIHIVDGGAVHVPTVDHVAVTPTGNRVFVFFDDGKYDTIRPLMISRLMIDRESNDASAS